MSNAKVVSLKVLPSAVSHLCFERGGILGEFQTELGATVAAFDFAAFYGLLGSIPTVPGHPARMLYDFLQIQAFVKPFTLASLRAEDAKATLDQAVNSRANAFYAKYANAPAIIARINQDYSPLNSDAKPSRLQRLSYYSNLQRDQISEAYASDVPPRTGVVKTTSSVLESQLRSSGTSATIDKTAEFESGGATFPPPEPNFAQTLGTPEYPVKEDFQESKTTSTGTATECQKVVNTDYAYRIPFLEIAAQNERAQISLIDEQFSQFVTGQNMPYLDAVFFNELQYINAEVYKTQIAYVNTILMSPIAGTVTGIYKNPGDAVRAGETVVRVENSADIFLVATLIYRGPISLGVSVSVTTTLFGLPGPTITISGNAVAVRGKREDDHWEVIVKCKNVDGAGNPLFPLGYHFDYDDTTVSIT